MLKLFFLGNLKVLYNDADITAQLGSKACALIFLLLESDGRMLQREKIISYLWPDSKDEAARYNLRYNLWEIKKTIKEDESGNPFLISDNTACRINEKYDFSCDFTAARDFDKRKRYTMAELLRYQNFFGGELYEGAYFKGCDELNNLILYRRIEFEKLKVQIMRATAELLEQEENYEAEIDVLREILMIEPYDEDVAYQLMDVYSKSGKRADALNFYKNFSNTLAFSINIAPGEALMEKYRQIQDGAQYDEFVRRKQRQPELSQAGGAHRRGEGQENDAAAKESNCIHITCMEGISYFWLSSLLKSLQRQYGEILRRNLSERELYCLGTIQSDLWRSASSASPDGPVLAVNIMNACIKAISSVARSHPITVVTRQREYLDRESQAFIRYIKAVSAERQLDITFAD